MRLHLAIATAALVLGLSAAPAAAAPIAAWDFGSGSSADVSGSPTAYDLVANGTGADLSLGFARFSGDEASPGWLEVSGPGGMSQYTVSLWVRSEGAIDQGVFQGILSNNSASTASFSWQIESYNGVYQWRNQAGTFAIGAPSGLGVWDHIVVRKFGGGDGDVWFNGVQVVSSLGANPGGLQSFRLGTNRNTSNFFQGGVDNVWIFDSLEAPPTLFATTAVPEPGLAGLLALGAAGALALARRQRRADA